MRSEIFQNALHIVLGVEFVRQRLPMSIFQMLDELPLSIQISGRLIEITFRM